MGCGSTLIRGDVVVSLSEGFVLVLVLSTGNEVEVVDEFALVSSSGDVVEVLLSVASSSGGGLVEAWTG